MQSSPNIPPQLPSQKVKNILIRHSCCKEVRLNSSFQSPEKFHLLKYSPKHYKTLCLEITNENRLQSKVKKIKKLKNFKGFFKQILPPKLWLNLLGNTRKEIEEIPQTTTTQSLLRPSPTFWANLTLMKVKFFPNVTSLFLPRRKNNYIIQDYDDISLVKKPVLGYMRNLRRVKSIEMVPARAQDVADKWMRERLGGMSQFLNRLEKLTINTLSQNVNLLELFSNKNFASHLTGLTFSFSMRRFDSNLVMIAEMCKNLRFLAIGFNCYVDENPDFLKFLTLIQGLPHLSGLEIGLPRSVKYYWAYFRPPTSLRSLKLRFDVSEMIKADFFGKDLKDINLCKDLLLGRWDNIKKLDQLEFSLSCGSLDELRYLKMFITLVMKKVCIIKSFEYSVYTYSKASDSSFTGEPFFVEEVPHLYGSLERFECNVQNSNDDGNQLKFDMKKMKVFRNLKEIVIDGNGIFPENIDEIVEVLEDNKDFPILELRLWSIPSADWLGDLLEKLYKRKRPERNLKMVLDLRFRIDDIAGRELSFLDELCDAIKSVGLIRGLLISIGIFARDDIAPISVEALREGMSKHAGVRNLMVQIGYTRRCLYFRKVDGEEEQHFTDDYEAW